MIGITTAGGDCPGLNAVIRGVAARVGRRTGEPIVGFRNGWEGIVGDDSVVLDRGAVRGILARGGTILGTSRFDPYVHADGAASVQPVLERHGIDCLVVVGGDGTLRTARRLGDDGIRVVGVPKTIDNDIPATDITFGFDTAVQVATEAIDRLTTTAEAHHRVMLVEVMGRTQGWIAVYAGIAAGADVILIPEDPMPLSEAVEIIKRRHSQGHTYSVVVVAEAYPFSQGEPLPVDAYGFTRFGGVASAIAPVLEEATGYETRVSVLGHLQRGGTPTAADRVLASRLGVRAADLALDGEHGVLVAVRGASLQPVPLAEIGDRPRPVPAELYDVSRTFFS